MPRSVFYIPTGSNIVWAGQKTALDDAELDDVDNQDKYLKNVGGNLTWIALPIPDISTLTSAEDGFSIVYDHGTTSFVMRDQRPAWNPEFDTNLRFWFDLSNASTMTFNGPNSNLDTLQPVLSSGGNFDLTGVNNSTTAIQHSTVEDGKKALEFTAFDQGLQFPANLIGDGSASFMLFFMVKDSNMATWDYLLHKDQADFSTELTIRTIATNTGNGTITVRSQGPHHGGQFGENDTAVVGLTYPYLFCFVYDKENQQCKHYINAVETSSVSSVTSFSLNTTKTTLLCTTGINANTNQTLDGFLYQVSMTNNITESNRQKWEGYFAHKYNINTNILPGAHPFYNSTPK